MSDVLSKVEARELVWRVMEMRGVARFPGSKGRIPNFVGAEQAALRLQSLPVWRAARVIKVGSDSPQLSVRRMALREGKVVYMAVPWLRSLECFLELDPQRLGPQVALAASVRGAERLGRPVRPEDVRSIDLVVCGAVAVNGRGARLGKGGGFSDLEYALLVEAGKIGREVPIVTTVHSVQILPQSFEMRPHDIPLDAAVTPEGALGFLPGFRRPPGLLWDTLTADRIGEVPILREWLDRR
jgi:5-formyltetrahydrofolate cyclo-ligase